MTRGGSTAVAMRDGTPPSTTPLLERLRNVATEGYPAPWVAERQAELLLSAAGIKAPAVPEEIVNAIALIEIRRWAGLSLSGMASRDGPGWVILLRAEDSEMRQRFTLLHELKHIIDEPLVDDVESHTGIDTPYRRSEHLANYFAACVLMPATWVRRDWAWGLRDHKQLGERYGVHRRGVQVRLSELGLIEAERDLRDGLFKNRARIVEGALP